MHISSDAQYFGSVKYTRGPLTVIPLDGKLLVGTGYGQDRRYIGTFTPEAFLDFVISAWEEEWRHRREVLDLEQKPLGVDVPGFSL